MQTFDLALRAELKVAVPQGVLDHARREASVSGDVQDDEAFMGQLLSQALTQMVREGFLRLEEAGMGVRRGPVEVLRLTRLDDDPVTAQAQALMDLPEKRERTPAKAVLLTRGAT